MAEFSQERWEQIDRVFAAALDHSAKTRESFVREVCQRDSSLLREVLTLLRHRDQAERVLGESAAAYAAPIWSGMPSELLDDGEALSRGTEMGPYRILREIGRGGMGAVYLAEQQPPLKRRVAIKLIRLGMDSRTVIARFEAERGALALMDHPNIARVYEAGVTESGRPYFVMEYVPGVRITDHCWDQRLGVRARLELFLSVCDGVRHTHRKGIIHRDLKPSNILVTDSEDGTVAKIIDFGVAKATEASGLADGTATQHGEVVGTPQYMSPEQLDPSLGGIDLRTDVFSLGAVLYELLVGEAPLHPDRGRGRDLGQIGLACQRPVKRPSRRLRELKTIATEVGGGHPLVSPREVQGDLDWITLKALEPQRELRYETVSELAGDLRRHLDHRPIQAGPPSARYRAAKFIRRQWLGVTAAAVLGLALLLGSAVATLAMLRAQRAERAARSALAEAEEVSDFLVDLFSLPEPGEVRANTVTAKELLDRGVEELVTDGSRETGTRFRLLKATGQIYVNLGLYEAGVRWLEAAAAAAAEAHPIELAELLYTLARTQAVAGESARSILSYRRAAELLEQRSGGGTGLRLKVKAGLAAELARSGRPTEAAAALEPALTQLRAWEAAPLDHDLATARGDVGAALFYLRRYDESLVLFRRHLDDQERLFGPGSLAAANALNRVGTSLSYTGEHDAAVPILRRAVELRQRHLGTDHPRVAEAMNNLGGALFALSQFESAIEQLEASLAIRLQTLPAEHPRISMMRFNLACAHAKTGELGDARAYLREALPSSDYWWSATGAAQASCFDALRHDPEVAALLEGLARIDEARSAPSR